MFFWQIIIFSLRTWLSNGVHNYFWSFSFISGPNHISYWCIMSIWFSRFGCFSGSFLKINVVHDNFKICLECFGRCLCYSIDRLVKTIYRNNIDPHTPPQKVHDPWCLLKIQFHYFDGLFYMYEFLRKNVQIPRSQDPVCYNIWRTLFITHFLFHY